MNTERLPKKSVGINRKKKKKKKEQEEDSEADGWTRF